MGNWNIYHCTCCKMDTHAVPDSSCLPFLLNPALVVCWLVFHFLSVQVVKFLNVTQVDANQISKLQQSERFSPVYKVVLPWLGNSGPSSPRHFPGYTGSCLDVNLCVSFSFDIRQGISSWPSCCRHTTNDVELHEEGRRKSRWEYSEVYWTAATGPSSLRDTSSTGQKHVIDVNILKICYIVNLLSCKCAICLQVTCSKGGSCWKEDAVVEPQEWSHTSHHSHSSCVVQFYSHQSKES